MSIGRTCCVSKCYMDDKSEKSEVMAEFVNRFTPDEMKWFTLFFILLSMDKNPFEKISGVTDLKVVVEKIYNMEPKEG